MFVPRTRLVSAVFVATLLAGPMTHAQVCENFGPQTPRDISHKAGENKVTFSLAPEFPEMNLCNIHFHKNAEHKGPGFSEVAGDGAYGGYRCNGHGNLDEKKLRKPKKNHCENVAPGDSIEVHWVYSSCDVGPGEGLKACSSTACGNPQLRVETQVFLVVNDRKAEDFNRFSNAKERIDGRYQARALPTGSGKPVIFLGSSTGKDFDHRTCSPLQITWSVRPECSHVDIRTLNKWCRTNDFNEQKAQGVRELVTDLRLLSKIP